MFASSRSASNASPDFNNLRGCRRTNAEKYQSVRSAQRVSNHHGPPTQYCAGGV